MNRQELLDLHKDMCDRAREIMTKKNHDYSGEKGDDPFANFRRCEAMGICSPLQGALVRLTDKMSRVSTFAAAGKLMVTDETVDDTLIDFINYAVLCRGMILEERGKKILENRGKTPVPYDYSASDICICGHEYRNHDEDGCKSCSCDHYKPRAK